MATIENFATVSFTSGGVEVTKTSNLAEIELESSLKLSKSTLGDTYSGNTPITYILSVTNNSTSTISNISVTDDLGTFVFNTLELTPLTFNDPALLLVNGQDSSAQLTVNTDFPERIIFTLPPLAAGATANIIYSVVPNNFAPLDVQSTITNTATLTSDFECAEDTASATITVLSAADTDNAPNGTISKARVNMRVRRKAQLLAFLINDHLLVTL